MDTWGQLKVLGAGATLEQLQLIDLVRPGGDGDNFELM
jgi:hypothetical protein